MGILGSFGPEDQALPLSELVRRTGLPKSTVHRMLAELVEHRLLERDTTGRYRLGGQLFELGMRASVERRLLEVAVPFLQDLYERTHETVHLGLLEGTEVVYVSKIGGHRQAQAPSRVGGRMPLHCTAIGKALLAHAGEGLLHEVVEQGLERRTAHTITAAGLLERQLATVVETGVAYEHEESAVGLVCIAAPVLAPDDRPIAAVSVTGPSTRFRPERHVAPVRAAASGIAATLARRWALGAGSL
jgi:DNA-binding IclR family transcriptional regulator